ncbi:hypothetical protein ACWDG1_48745 [Streptomyces sp. NPDC001177]
MAAMATLGAVAAVLTGVLALQHKGTESSTVHSGATCSSQLPQDLDLSCGLSGFGDLRYACAAVGDHNCHLTTALTLRNTGRSQVYVAMITGPRQGVREPGAEKLVRPGEAVTLRPETGHFLFDVLVRRGGDGPGALTVVDVS